MATKKISKAKTTMKPTKKTVSAEKAAPKAPSIDKTTTAPVTDARGEKVLEVKNLRVSFWTNNGTVKAVRGISFSLYKGRTLAIVGESGSGKSVTSRSIMGILQNNKIIEDGQILYDGHDLLRLDEEDFTKIRGSRISMIFQDPLSALNPIMKVGPQLTEAMILKAKATRHYAKTSLAIYERYLLAENKAAPIDGFAEAYERLKKCEDVSAIPAEDKGTIEKIFSSTLTNNYAKLSKTRQEALDYIKKGQSDLISGHTYEDFSLPSFKLFNKGLKKVMLDSLDELSPRKDDESATFYNSCLYAVKEYQMAVKDRNKEKKDEEKRQKLIAKGKKVEDSIKKRAFSRELVMTPSNVFDRISKLFADQIEHITGLVNEKTTAYDVNVALNFFCSNVKDSHYRVSKQEAKARAIKLMEEVDIPEAERRFTQYPFEFSGGMRQRIVIAIALSSNPDILICDEPTTALDVTVQAQILDVINRLKKERDLSVIFITHNLGVVANMADDIAVMYAGKIVEFGTAEDVFYDPRHPYTWALLSSMPDLFTKEKIDPIPGTPPNMILPPKGDAFAQRNKYAMKIDFEEQPPFFKVSPTHYAATWLLDPRAPKVDPPKIVTERIKNMRVLVKKMSEEQAGKE